MKIKAKVTLGVVFLFASLLVTGGVALYYIYRLSEASDNIIKANYESLEYSRKIIEEVQAEKPSWDTLENNLRLQESNITETGEREATIRLRSAYELFRANPSDSTALKALLRSASEIQNLNLNAIHRKNRIAKATAENASNYLVITLSMFAILAFTLMVNFPGYVANPIVQLTNSIKLIARKNYEERLHFNRKDEFEELANAFNDMAEKLDEYEHSNLAQILFEKKRIESIIGRMSDPVLGLDEKRKFIFANKEALILLNIPEEKLDGSYAPDLAVENDLIRHLIRVDSTRENIPIKIYAHGKESYFMREVLEINYTPTGEKKPVPLGQVIILKDITSFKELDMAKTNFIATISHELKTPLASLQICFKLMEDARVGGLNKEQSDIMKTASEEVARLLKITNELLNLSQVETGKMSLLINPVHPDEVIHFALEAVKFQAERKGVKIKTSYSQNLPNIRLDKEKTSWVLINLLTNAIRYSFDNGDIILSCRYDGKEVRVEVEDFGTGIENQYLPKLFDRFYQVPGTSSGTGLGLAISRDFIEAQGGQIYVSSEWSKGSKFGFRFPAAP